jgi:hypothetical protein
MTNNNTFTIIEQTNNITFKHHNGCMVYTGIVEMEHGIRTTQDFIDALDSNNFGGTVDFHKTDKANTYTFVAYVYID